MNEIHTEGLSRSTKQTVDSVQIEAETGPGKGARLKLSSGTITIGSAKDCDLVLKDAAVSRHHATVELLPGRVRVRDNGSRNGTRFLGSRITDATVPVGGVIEVGRTTLRFQPAAQAGVSLSEREELEGLLGRSAAMRGLFAMIEKLGPSDGAVVLQGETGVGKDALAKALHARSPRAAAPFVTFDCASVNASLIESSLFGHRPGAFTDARTAHIGALEQVGAGTLYLDELGELPLELQPKLLRVLEARQFLPLGASAPVTFGARVIVSSHSDLAAMVKEGRFRADLYYRVAATVLVIPPLRSRPEDIPLLAKHFAKGEGDLQVELAPATLAALQSYPWPGNVRELKNAVLRVMLLGAEGSSPEPEAVGSYQAARDLVVDRFERDYLIALLERHQGNVSAAAREAGLSRSRFYRMLDRQKLLGASR